MHLRKTHSAGIYIFFRRTVYYALYARLNKIGMNPKSICNEILFIFSAFTHSFIHSYDVLMCINSLPVLAVGICIIMRIQDEYGYYYYYYFIYCMNFHVYFSETESKLD